MYSLEICIHGRKHSAQESIVEGTRIAVTWVIPTEESNTVRSDQYVLVRDIIPHCPHLSKMKQSSLVLFPDMV